MRSRTLGLAVAAVACGLVLAAALLVGRMTPSRPVASPEPTSRRLVVEGQHLWAHARGEGEPVMVFLHGFGGSGKGHWGEVIRRLPCGGRAIALDLLGFGASSRPNAPYDLDMHRRYLLGALDALDVPRAVLVGLSMGASLAALTASRDPDRVSGVVLLAPSGLPGTLTYPGPRGVLYRPGWLNATATAIARTPLFGFLFPDSLARQALGVTGSYDARFAAALDGIEQPVLLAWSRSDDRVPFEASEAYRRRIPNLVFREAPAEAGHAISVDAPQWTAEVVCDFVAGLPRAGAGESP